MKLLFFSDIHGMAVPLEQLLEQADALQADRLILLGDILAGSRCHPDDGPERVIKLLNARSASLIAVRGNCDAEPDLARLRFSVTPDHVDMRCDDRTFFLTHGHLWNEFLLPELPENSVLVMGHTHEPARRRSRGITIFNPGSIGAPRSGYPATFGFYDRGELSIRRLSDGRELSV